MGLADAERMWDEMMSGNGSIGRAPYQPQTYPTPTVNISEYLDSNRSGAPSSNQSNQDHIATFTKGIASNPERLKKWNALSPAEKDAEVNAYIAKVGGTATTSSQSPSFNPGDFLNGRNFADMIYGLPGVGGAASMFSRGMNFDESQVPQPAPKTAPINPSQMQRVSTQSTPDRIPSNPAPTLELPFPELLSGIGGALGNTGQGLGGALGNLGTGLGGALGNLGPKMGNVMGSQGRTMGDLAGGTGNLLGNMASMAGNSAEVVGDPSQQAYLLRKAYDDFLNAQVGGARNLYDNATLRTPRNEPRPFNPPSDPLPSLNPMDTPFGRALMQLLNSQIDTYPYSDRDRT